MNFLQEAVMEDVIFSLVMLCVVLFGFYVMLSPMLKAIFGKDVGKKIQKQLQKSLRWLAWQPFRFVGWVVVEGAKLTGRAIRYFWRLIRQYRHR